MLCGLSVCLMDSRQLEAHRPRSTPDQTKRKHNVVCLGMFLYGWIDWMVLLAAGLEKKGRQKRQEIKFFRSGEVCSDGEFIV